MTTFFYSVLGFILAIGILATVHEYGHFLVARLLGVKVLRFCIGFGKPLIKWYDERGTEYAIAAIPLGGYVKMLDQNEGKVASKDLPHAFNTKPVWARMLIIAAGPLFNLAFAVLAYWVVFMCGIVSIVPIIGDVERNTIAYSAHLHAGQEIISIDNRSVATWEDIAVALAEHIGDQDSVTIQVRDIHTNVTSAHILNLSSWSANNDSANILGTLGLSPYDPLKPVIGKLMPDYPAVAAGLQEGDQILQMNGTEIANRSQFLHMLHNEYDKPIHLLVLRNHQSMQFTITPVETTLDNGEKTGFIGIQFAIQPWPAKFSRTQRYAPLPALGMAWDRTKDYSVLTVEFLGKMLTGKVSSQNISGPISIARYAGSTMRTDIESFLGFLAIISISLGILNMLPIPILDGGHFLFCIIELVRGKPLSGNTIRVGYMFGIVLLGGVMVLAFYNDIVRLIQ